MNRPELRNESTLSAIAENVEHSQHALLFAVIIDVTECKREKQGDPYVTSLKVVDPSFNYKTQIKNEAIKFHKFFKINLQNETPEKAPQITHIGEIIRLRRFRYKVTNRGQIIGYEQPFSNWLIYQGYQQKPTKNNNQALFHKEFDKNLQRELNDYESGRLQDLREWSSQFFAQNSITYINWWNWHEKSSEKVDFIVQFQKIHQNQYMIMIDNKQSYLLKMPNMKKENLGQLFFLRCFNLAATKGANAKVADKELVFTPKSGAILIPDYFYDYKKFHNYLEEKPKQTDHLIKEFDFLINFKLDKVNIQKGKSTPKKGKTLVTVFKNIYTKPFSTGKQLKEVFNNASIYRNEIFLFEGSIVGFSETNPIKFLKVMDLQSKSIKDFSQFKGTIKDKSHRVIYHFSMQIKDQSINQPLDVYISTISGDHHLFSTWNIFPESD